MRGNNLEGRLFNFALSVQKIIQPLPKTESNRVYGRQVMRSSASVGANYAEATCALTKKDFAHDVNRSRKEAKETLYWLNLLAEVNHGMKPKMGDLLREAEEIVKILSRSAKTARS